MPKEVDYQVLAALATIRHYIVENLQDMGLPAVASYAELAGRVEKQMGIE